MSDSLVLAKGLVKSQWWLWPWQVEPWVAASLPAIDVDTGDKVNAFIGVGPNIAPDRDYWHQFARSVLGLNPCEPVEKFVE